MLLEKVGMRTHALKNQVLAVDFVNEQPIRFDETVMSPLPITDKIVIAVNGVQRLIGEQGSRNNFEFFRIKDIFKISIRIKMNCYVFLYYSKCRTI